MPHRGSGCGERTQCSLKHLSSGYSVSAFGCHRHRHRLSRVFTIYHHTDQVCDERGDSLTIRETACAPYQRHSPATWREADRLACRLDICQKTRRLEERASVCECRQKEGTHQALSEDGMPSLCGPFSVGIRATSSIILDAVAADIQPSCNACSIAPFSAPLSRARAT